MHVVVETILDWEVESFSCCHGGMGSYNIASGDKVQAWNFASTLCFSFLCIVIIVYLIGQSYIHLLHVLLFERSIKGAHVKKILSQIRQQTCIFSAKLKCSLSISFHARAAEVSITRW